MSPKFRGVGRSVFGSLDAVDIWAGCVLVVESIFFLSYAF